MKRKTCQPPLMRQIKRLASSSLVITVVISLILSIFCSSVILLAYYNRQSQKATDIESRISDNLASVTNLVLADSVVYQISHTDSFDLFNEGRDSVLTDRYLWGLYEVASVKSYYGKFSKEASFFYGPTMGDSLDACVYLAEHQRPLSLVGNVRLIGDAYLSKAGLKTSYIDQRGFSYDKLIQGKIKISDASLPGLNVKVIDNIKALLQMCNDTGLNRNVTEGVNQDSVFRSFKESVLIKFQKGKLFLSNCKLQGKIIIMSDSAIEVDQTARLKNVIIVAPVIVIKQGFQGTVQAIASDSLIVENNCIFEYPSALVLVKKETETLQNRMIIGENCSISGLLFSGCMNNDLYKSFVEIKDNTRVNGIVYIMGYLNLKADITGVVLTDFFIYKTPTTIYENYLVDVQINRLKLSEYFLTSSLINSPGNKGIIQWLK